MLVQKRFHKRPVITHGADKEAQVPWLLGAPHQLLCTPPLKVAPHKTQNKTNPSQPHISGYNPNCQACVLAPLKHTLCLCFSLEKGSLAAHEPALSLSVHLDNQGESIICRQGLESYITGDIPGCPRGLEWDSVQPEVIAASPVLLPGTPVDFLVERTRTLSEKQPLPAIWSPLVS